MPTFLERFRLRRTQPRAAQRTAEAEAVKTAAAARQAERERQNARVRARRLLTYDTAAARAVRDYDAGVTLNPFTTAFADDWKPAGAWEATRAQLADGRDRADLTRPDGTLVSQDPADLQAAYLYLNQGVSVTDEHNRHDTLMQAGVDAWENDVAAADAALARALAAGISAERLGAAQQLAEEIDQDLEVEELLKPQRAQREHEEYLQTLPDPAAEAAREAAWDAVDAAERRRAEKRLAGEAAWAAADYDIAFTGGLHADGAANPYAPYPADEDLRDAWDAGERHRRALDELTAATGELPDGQPGAPIARRPDGSEIGVAPSPAGEEVYQVVIAWPRTEEAVDERTARERAPAPERPAPATPADDFDLSL